MTVNPDPGYEAPPEAIVAIFGAAVRPDGEPTPALRRRVEAALRFANGRPNVIFIPTGGQGRFGPPEAVVMARLLTQAGVQGSTILREITGTDTLSSVRAVVAIIRTLPAAPVYACSSAYHLPRCLLLLRLAGISARACPAPPVPAAAGLFKRWFWRLREVPALPYDAALMLWHRANRRV